LILSIVNVILLKRISFLYSLQEFLLRIFICVCVRACVRACVRVCGEGYSFLH